MIVFFINVAGMASCKSIDIIINCDQIKSMPKTFSFATGNIWRWNKSENRNILINYARKLDNISGVEITFASKEDLYLFRLSESNRRWLRTLDYVTIHAPFRLVRDSEDEEEVIRQLDMISKLYKDVNAKDVIIHPRDIPAKKVLGRYDFNISTENMPRRSAPISYLKDVLDRHPKMRFCLDVSHAYIWSKHETGKLVRAFRNRISQVHLSGTYKRKSHQSLRCVTDEFMRSIEPVKDLDVPIIIEEDIKTKSLGYVRDEIEYIKRMFD